MWNLFKVKNKDTRTTSVTSFWCFCCQLWTYFTPCPSVSLVKFEQVNVCWLIFPVNIYLFKFNNITMKSPERRQWLFIVNFEYISYLSFTSVSIVEFKQVIYSLVRQWYEMGWKFYDLRWKLFLDSSKLGLHSTIRFEISFKLFNRFYLITTAQKMKFSITEFFSKCDQIHEKLRIWSHLLKKSVMENLIFCAVYAV